MVTGADRTFRTPAGAIETLPPDAPDPTFGTEQPPGWTRVYAGESSSFLNSGVRLPDGRILAVGQDAVASVGQWTLERFLPDGRPDPSFGDGGVREIDVGPLGGVARDIELLPDGRFVVVGTATDERGGFDRAAFAAMRFHPDGEPDDTFGVGGRRVFALGEDSTTSPAAVSASRTGSCSLPARSASRAPTRGPRPSG